MDKNNNISKLDILEDRIIKSATAHDILSNIKVWGHWVRSMDGVFLDISTEAAKILFWLTPEQCIGKTSLWIVKSEWLDIDKNRFPNVCMASDKHILDNSKDWKYWNYTFIEFITGIDWKKHIWRTLKGIAPPVVGREQLIWGQAEFLDETIWYEKCMDRVIKNPNLQILNKNLYIYE